MSVTINGITCEEIVRDYQESAEIGTGISSRKGYLCDWNSRFAVAQGLLGFTSAAGKNGPVTVTTGMRHPELAYCFVRAVEFEPKGKPTRGAYQTAWDKCIVWASFGPARNLQWGAVGFGDGTHGFIYAEQKIATSCEWVTIPGRRLKFYTSNETIKTETGFRIGIAEIEITLHDLPYFPDYTVFNMTGQVNNAPFLGVATGKLVFNGVTTQESASSTGVYTLEATYSFTARTQRWDYGFDGLTNTWDLMVSVGGTHTSPITLADFSVIFPAGYYY